MVIDAEVVTGGGFVQRDAAGDYVGALELQLGKIGVKAIGLLSTGRDWSMLLLLYAQIPPVQIGFGFLDGIGGVIGVQRAVDVNQLVNGMRTGAFDDLLFPADPVGDAPRIIATLRQLFPMRRNALTVGPMVDVHWGKPVVVTARLAVLIQLDNALGGGPLAFSKVVVVGQLRVAVGPTQEDPDARVLLLNIDVLGFWDLAEKRYGFLAALRDSASPASTSPAAWPSGVSTATTLVPPRRRLQPSLQGRPCDRGQRRRLGVVLGRPVRPDPDRLLRGHARDDPGRLNLHASAKIGPVGLTGEIGFDVLDLPPAAHTSSPTSGSPPRSPTAGTAWPASRSPARSRVPAAGTSWGRSASPSCGGTSPSRSTSPGEPRHLWSASRSTSGRCWPPSWPPENWSAEVPTGGQAVVTLAPRRGDLSPRAHPSPGASSSSRPCRWAWPWTGSATRWWPGRTSSTSRP